MTPIDAATEALVTEAKRLRLTFASLLHCIETGDDDGAALLSRNLRERLLRMADDGDDGALLEFRAATAILKDLPVPPMQVEGRIAAAAWNREMHELETSLTALEHDVRRMAGRLALRPKWLQKITRTHFWSAIALLLLSGIVWAAFAFRSGRYGLHGDYYEGRDFAKYVRSRVDPSIDFAWGDESPLPKVPADGFSIRWMGTVKVPKTDRWTFMVASDDGVRLWVDGRRIIDDWHSRPWRENSGSIDLRRGNHSILIEYFDDYADAGIKLYWKDSGIEPLRIIHPKYLRQPSGS